MELSAGVIFRNPQDGLEGVVLGIEKLSGNPVAQLPLLGDEPMVLGGKIEVLETIGHYDRAIEDPTKCGIGKGEKTCAYLSRGLGHTAFTCARFSEVGIEIERRLSEGTMVAKGKPVAMRPGCQQEIIESL